MHMSTQTLVRKLSHEVRTLRKDISDIRTLVLKTIRDEEGEYKSAFVRKMMRRARDIPAHRYTDRASFMKLLHGRKK